MCNSLKDYYDIKGETLLIARKSSKSIPKEGKLPNGIYFNFHGSGCYFEFETGGLDMDFGPDDRCDGFDFQRIVYFLELSKLPKYKAITDFDDLENQFKKLISDKTIVCPQFSPGPYLYYLSTNLA